MSIPKIPQTKTIIKRNPNQLLATNAANQVTHRIGVDQKEKIKLMK